MRALSVLTAYTEREYVGLECLWLEAMSALLLVIGMLNSCCEAKKLSESCAGIIGSIVLASLGVAAAVVIRLPCVPLHPEIAVEAAVDEMGSGMVPPDLLSDLLLTFPMTLLTLASLGSSSAVFLAGAGAGKEDGGGGAKRRERKQRHREGEQQIRQEVRGNHARAHLIHGCLDCDFWVQGHAGQPDHDGGSHAERGQDDRADDARAALAQLLGLTARVEHPDHQQERGHGLQPQALEADVLALGVRGQNAQRTHDRSVRRRGSLKEQSVKSRLPEDAFGACRSTQPASLFVAP